MKERIGVTPWEVIPNGSLLPARYSVCIVSRLCPIDPCVSQVTEVVSFDVPGFYYILSCLGLQIIFAVMSVSFPVESSRWLTDRVRRPVSERARSIRSAYVYCSDAESGRPCAWYKFVDHPVDCFENRPPPQGSLPLSASLGRTDKSLATVETGESLSLSHHEMQLQKRGML